MGADHPFAPSPPGSYCTVGRRRTISSAFFCEWSAQTCRCNVPEMVNFGVPQPLIGRWVGTDGPFPSGREQESPLSSCPGPCQACSLSFMSAARSMFAAKKMVHAPPVLRIVRTYCLVVQLLQELDCKDMPIYRPRVRSLLSLSISLLPVSGWHLFYF